MVRGPAAGRRSRLAAACGLAFLVLAAAPAHAGLPDPVPSAVDDVTAQAGGVVDEVVGAVRDGVDAAAGAVSDATGGASDPVTDPVQDAVDDVAATAHDAEHTVDGAAGTVADTVDDVVDAVDHATGRGSDGPAGEGHKLNRRADDRVRARRTAAPHARRRAKSALGSRRRHPAGSGSLTLAHAPRDGSSAGDAAVTLPSPALGERLRRAAIDASKQLAVPLALTLLILAFVIAQHWADRRDPKLALAPLDSDHDLLTFG